MRPITKTGCEPVRDRRGLFGSSIAALRRLRAYLRRRTTFARRPPSSVAAIGPCAAWLGDRRGVAGVEFAMLALPFIALLCVNAEAGVVVLAQQTLDVSVDRASRLLRTGEFQDRADGTDPTQRLRKEMCRGGGIFFVCRDVRFEVTRAGKFTNSAIVDPYDNETRDVASGFGTQFQCPTGSDVITVRAAVPIMRLFGFLDFTGRRLSDNRQLLVSTAIFRTEAYDAKPCQ